MLAASACRSRFFVIAIVASLASIFLVLFTFSESLSTVPFDYAHKAQGYWEAATNKGPSSSSSSSSSKSHAAGVYNCDDPYRRPGYLHIDSADRKKTQWVPYTDDFLDADTPDYAQYPPPQKDIYFNVTDVESQFLNSPSTPKKWMQLVLKEDQRRRDAVDIKSFKQKAKDFVSMKDDGGLGWLWGRRILVLGDSVDRFMIQFFCEEFGREMQQPPKGHTTAHCAIPTLNLTLIHWHFAGAWTSKPEWWWLQDMEAVAFEERWDKMWAPTLNKMVRGPTGQPDLIMWQNGLWDQRALWELGEAHYTEDQFLGQRERHLVWQEIRFVGARMRKLVERLAKEFPNVPTMFRAISVHRESNARDANLYELDRLSRAVAEKAGHEMFEWARIIAGFSMLYKDQTHPGKGPGSWLWGNMMLEYVARGAGIKDPERSPYFDGWDACHDHLAHWGGR